MSQVPQRRVTGHWEAAHWTIVLGPTDRQGPNQIKSPQTLNGEVAAMLQSGWQQTYVKALGYDANSGGVIWAYQFQRFVFDTLEPELEEATEQEPVAEGA